MKQKLFTKDFTLVAAGQVVSLFGNAIIRFALLLYFLNQTGSSALYGMVTAFAMIPSILLSPIGGILADRINKRNIMVALDFFTAVLILGFALLMGHVNLIVLLVITLVILFGITGAYQPAVQASIPALAEKENFMAANSVINTISYFSSLVGPVLGGILYSTYGLEPVLYVCIVCFFLSAVMEIFITIPYVKRPSGERIGKLVKNDFSESLRFIREEKPVIGKGLLVICGINLFLSAMITVGLPYLVTEVLEFPMAQANRLYGFAEGILAAGGLIGGICAGIFANRFSVQKAGRLITICALCVFPMGGVLPGASGFVAYGVLTLCCFAILFCSTIFSIQMLAFIQAETPEHLIGKVIAVVLTIAMCAQPLGNALYGILFEFCQGFEYAAVLFSGVVSLVLALWAERLFARL